MEVVQTHAGAGCTVADGCCRPKPDANSTVYIQTYAGYYHTGLVADCEPSGLVVIADEGHTASAVMADAARFICKPEHLGKDREGLLAAVKPHDGKGYKSGRSAVNCLPLDVPGGGIKRYVEPHRPNTRMTHKSMFNLRCYSLELPKD